MRRPRLGFAIAAVSLTSLAVLIVAACKGGTRPIPPNGLGYCDIQHLGGLAPDGSVDSCNNCLQVNCCDAYGACESDTAQGPGGAPSCEGQVAAQYSCLIDAGAHAKENEIACGQGVNPNGKNFYACMTKNCSPDCALGDVTCSPNSAVPQIRSPQCDLCLSQRCCQQLNTCYGQRECSLAFDCIISTCGDNLNVAFANPGAELPGITSATQKACSQQPIDNSLPDASCINGCLQTYLPISGGSQPDPGILAAACYQLSFFSCALSECPSECLVFDDGGIEGGVTDGGADASD